MKKFRICSIAFVVLLLSTTPAHAISFRSSSVEWQTDLADILVICRVQAKKSIEPLNEYRDSQEVTCHFVEAVKGEWSKPISFRQDYPSQKHPDTGVTQRINKGQRILLFLSVSKRRVAVETLDWINLSSPVRKRGPTAAAYDNDSKLLTNELSILKVVRRHAVRKLERKRGLIVEFPFFPPEDARGYYHDFVTTAEPEFKQQFIDQLQSKYHGDRCSAIFNLVSYPSDATRRLIRPFLSDSATATVGNYGGEGRDITYYPVRQAAYVALALLNDNPPLPKPYFEKIMPPMFGTGFENEVHFPEGNWKRLKDIVDPPGNDSSNTMNPRSTRCSTQDAQQRTSR